MFKFALAAFVVLAVGVAAQKNFTGYVVTGQWDGRTVPSPQWALDITRQDTEWRFQQELKLQNLIPTTAGDGLAPSFTSYDPISRTYFMTTARNQEAASLWGIRINNDVSASTPVNSEVRYAFPEFGATLVGLQVFPNGGAGKSSLPLTVLAFFNAPISGNCTVLSIDYTTGSSSFWGNLCPGADNNRTMTTAIEKNYDSGVFYVVTQSGGTDPNPDRRILTVDLITGAWTEVAIKPLVNHDPNFEVPFEMQWLPAPINALLVFYVGNFDQLIYTDPVDGTAAFAINDLSQFGLNGQYEFISDDFLQDDDCWTNSAFDIRTNKLYFQCTDYSEEVDDITLCQIDIPATRSELAWVNAAIQPMTYGYVGMEYVQVVV